MTRILGSLIFGLSTYVLSISAYDIVVALHPALGVR